MNTRWISLSLLALAVAAGCSSVEPATISAGDQLHISCRWDNSPTNQPMISGQLETPEDAFWGEGTTDEMCVGFMLAAPLQ